MVIIQCIVNGFAIPAEAHELGVLEHPELVGSYSTSSSGITTGSVFSCPAGVICSNPIMSVLLSPRFT